MSQTHWFSGSLLDFSKFSIFNIFLVYSLICMKFAPNCLVLETLWFRFGFTVSDPFPLIYSLHANSPKLLTRTITPNALFHFFTKRHQMSQLMRLWYLSHRLPVKAQASLRIHAVSPEPSLFAHMKYGIRWRVRPKIRHLAPLDGCACALIEWLYRDEKCHNLMNWLKYVSLLFLWMHANRFRYICWESKVPSDHFSLALKISFVHFWDAHYLFYHVSFYLLQVLMKKQLLMSSQGQTILFILTAVKLLLQLRVARYL